MSATPRIITAAKDGDTSLGVVATPDGRLWVYAADPTSGNKCVDLTDYHAEPLYHALQHFLHCESCRAGRVAADGYEKAIQNSVE